MESASSRIRAMLLAAVMAALPMSWRRCDAAEFVDVRMVGPFVCRADFPLAKVKSSLDRLPSLQADLTKRLGIPPAENGTEIYLFQGKSTYTKVRKPAFPRGAAVSRASCANVLSGVSFGGGVGGRQNNALDVFPLQSL